MHAVWYLSQQVLDNFDAMYGDFEENIEGSLTGYVSTSTAASRSILEENIEITERPFGIRFKLAPNGIFIEEILINSLASGFLLSRGDKLTKINKMTLSDLTPSAALKLFNQTKLPFTATFEKSLFHFLGESSDKQQQEPPINPEPINPNATPLPSLPTHVATPKFNLSHSGSIDMNAQWLDSNDFTFDDLDVLGISLKNMKYLDYDDTPMPGFENCTPFSPKLTDSEYESQNEAITPNINTSPTPSPTQTPTPYKRNSNIRVGIHFRDESDFLEETSNSELCEFSFGSLNFGNDQSMNSSSMETPMPADTYYTHKRLSAKYAKLKDADHKNVELLKDLLSDGNKAKEAIAKLKSTQEQMLVPPSPDPIDISQLDDIFDSLPKSRIRKSNPVKSILSQKNKKFLRKYLWMDPKGIFDEYIYHDISDENIVIGDTTPNAKCSLRLKLQQMSRSTTFNDKSKNMIEGYDEDKVVAIISSQGLNKGYHEWSFKILQCDIYRQEIGVIGVGHIKDMRIHMNGLKDTASFGARAIYGNELLTESLYYASYNRNNKQRCYRDLSSTSKIGWCTGDILRVTLDLDKFKIKFFINDKKVRKTMSLERYNIYYPIISFSGHCRYELLEFK